MGILDNAKEIAELIKKYNDQELYQKIVDLRDEIFILKEDNLGLKEKLKELESAFEIKVKLKKEGNLYYVISENGEKEGPYCLTCWDDDKKLIHVILHHDPRTGTTFSCHRCSKLMVKKQ
jgi:hypothetical protein